MPAPCNRRTALQIVGSSIALALAGCTTNQDPEEQKTSPNQTTTPTQEPIKRDDFTVDVEVAQQFTDNHPAQIRTTLTNTAETPLTLFTGITPPFTSYLSAEESNNRRLILVPDVSDSDRDPLAWMGEGDDPLPTNPENGCWKVTQDVLVKQTGIAMGLEPEEAVSQQYAVYGYQNDGCLPSGDYDFVDDATLHRGLLSNEASEFGITHGFTLTLNEQQSLSVKKHEPTISKHA